MLELIRTSRTDPRLLESMPRHYSEPKGFVGRNICYAVTFDHQYYGHIVGGSATRFLPGRNEALKITLASLNRVVSNLYFHCERRGARYPLRNFTTRVIRAWREQIARDWAMKYGDHVVGFETLIELPRTGELYLRDGWRETGVTKGYTCKRAPGRGTDEWSGHRVWDTQNLRPKRVLVRRAMDAEVQLPIAA